jgi:sugar lactone lactonase YvrE
VTLRYEIETAYDAANVTGECPLWHPTENRLYWIDTRLPSIQRLERDGSVRVWHLPGKVGSFVFRESGGLILGLEQGFCAFDLETSEITLLVNPEPDRPDVRLNDGKCDRRGRYWCGTMHQDGKLPLGALFRYDALGKCTKMDTGFIISNGMAFSPDNRTMIFGDSTGNTIFQYDFDLESGGIGNKRVFLDTRGLPWHVDGATFDSEGYYWCALIYDGAIGRFDPIGRLDRLIRLPVQHPTMCNFGGDNLDILYVTSGRRFLTEDELRTQPLAGALFAIHGLGVRGVREPFFAS